MNYRLEVEESTSVEGGWKCLCVEHNNPEYLRRCVTYTQLLDSLQADRYGCIPESYEYQDANGEDACVVRYIPFNIWLADAGDNGLNDELARCINNMEKRTAYPPAKPLPTGDLLPVKMDRVLLSVSPFLHTCIVFDEANQYSLPSMLKPVANNLYK